jgi:hypothetical protein
MSYITSSLSPYRSKDLSQEFFEILEEDYEWVCSSLESRGLIFLIAFIVLMSMSLLKAIVHVIEQSQKPVMTYEHLNLNRGMHSESITDILTRREAIDEVENHDNLCPNTKVKTQRANTFNALRGYLYQHDLTLHVETIKKINHRISEEELVEMYRTGEITKPLSTTHITFGEELNHMLKEVLGSHIDLKTNKITQETYIRVLNDDFLSIKEELQKVYNEPIKLKFD